MADSKSEKFVAQMLLDAAHQDEAACAVLANAESISDAMVGFHAQQAVEKSLKAVLGAHGIEFRRTHDLVTLLDLLEDNNVPPPPGADWIDELNPYAVEARYGTIEPEGLDRRRTLQVVKQILDWAREQVAERVLRTDTLTVDSPEKFVDGAGLGLALKLTSQEGKGTTFSIEIQTPPD